MHVTPEAAHRFIVRLIDQHRALEAHTAELQRLLAAREWLPAVVALETLHDELARHDGVEENVLFPLVGHAAPALGERLDFVRIQHRASEVARRALQLQLFRGETDDTKALGDELFARLSANHLSEELLLYGALEAVLVRGDHPIV